LRRRLSCIFEAFGLRKCNNITEKASLLHIITVKDIARPQIDIRNEGIKMKNVGNADRVIRIILAIILFSLFFLLSGNYKWFGLLGLIPLITAIVGVCPLYSILHISTKRK
jgi:hypothetical protein